MKVLWFTNTPSKASAEFGYKSFGGGWISSLESLISSEQSHELGICFFYSGTEFKKLVKDNVVYYGMPYQVDNFISRIRARHTGALNDTHDTYVDRVLQDFKPDLVHVFGTEQGYGKILMNRFDKVLFHIQGVIEPYSQVFFPNGFSKKNVWRNSTLKEMLTGTSFYHRYLGILQRAKREKEIMRHWKYFSGRTQYDHNYTKLLNPSANYYHCEELLREDFFRAQWTPPALSPKGNTIVIGTTINPNIYKGLDLIYKTVALLKEFKIHWKVFGVTADRDVNRIIKNVMGIKAPVKEIEFCGPLGSAQLIEALQTCHFFVHPSYIDNSPNSVCEAMLMGMPVISSAVGGVNSLITHKKSGYLYNPYDAYELAGLIIQLSNQYDEALAVAKNAKQVAEKRHSPQGILQTVNAMYADICSR